MKLTTKVRYAARAMLDVALNSSDGPVPMKDIALRQGIPESYLRQLAIPLRTAGLIRIIRGPRGGLELVKPPIDITISEIAVAMEGRVSLVECVYDPSTCSRSASCPTRGPSPPRTSRIVPRLKRASHRIASTPHRRPAWRGCKPASAFSRTSASLRPNPSAFAGSQPTTTTAAPALR